MFVIVGLGNPEKKFRNTPHNIGKEILNFLQTNWKKKHNFSNWKTTKKFKAQISKGKIGKKKVLLVKPLVFMNLSGETVSLIVSFFKIPSRNLIIVHDDIDLTFGQLKISKNRGAAGHKGVLSIFKKIGTKNFIRIRVGVRPKSQKPKNLETFVLKKFKREDQKLVKKITVLCSQIIEIIVEHSLRKAMNDLNK